MKHLNNDEKIRGMFKYVIFVTVSEEMSIEKLQEAIMQRLNLGEFRTDTVKNNAHIISDWWNEKKCLILLDEVCQTIKLDEVMVIRSNQNHIKVVLASRYPHICSRMDTDVEIKVEPFSPDDAWKMFKKNVGKAISNSDIQAKARLLVAECHRFPLVIDVVSKTFKKNQTDLTLLDELLKSLQRWDSDRIDGIGEMLDRLKVCYKCLKDEEKDCFLYGALYPAESMIYVDYLIECWRAEDFIRHAEEFRNARSGGHKILCELIELSFLERTAKTKYVTMNKLFRKLALDILSQKDNKYLAKPWEGLQEFPHPENVTKQVRSR
ncbi:probable disease resistance protein At5g43730 [Vitis riparia]|uniref:probable disease resistance protein At5g43730 n=1 Tax=Vitis riparia TaxID=96939 RepID=UPI00155A847B|nr:probable disease resistance protein At5g43730 [Vitis riparia]